MRWHLVLASWIALAVGLPVHGQVNNYVIEPFVAGSFSSPQGIASDRAGNLYIANDNETVSLVASDGTVSLIPIPGLTLPTGVAVDPNGNVFVASSGNSTIYRLKLNGDVGVFIDASAGLSAPEGLAFDKQGNLYVSNYGTRSILKYSPAGAMSVFLDGSHGLTTQRALTFDPSGNLYLSDVSTAQIDRIAPDGSFSVFARGVLGNGLASDSAGTLYVADYGNGRVQKITPDGTVSTLTPLFAAADIAFAADGNLYATNTVGNAVNRVTLSGSVASFSTSALALPFGLAFDASGTLFTTSSGAGTISKITSLGGISTIASGLMRPFTIAFNARDGSFLFDGPESIYRLLPDGTISTFANFAAADIAVTPTGTVFATSAIPVFRGQPPNNNIVRFAADGTASVVLSSTLGPFGRLIFSNAGDLYAEYSGGSPSNTGIAELSQAGAAVTNFPVAYLGPMAVDPSPNAVGVITYVNPGQIAGLVPSGLILLDVNDPTANGSLTGLAVDPVGNYFFAGPKNQISRILRRQSSLLAAVTPSSRSIGPGGSASFFASVVNTFGSRTNCQPQLAPVSTTLTLDYWARDPVTHAIVGARDQPVALAPGASQDFVVTITASAPVTLARVPLRFVCDGVTHSPDTIGVTTIDVNFSARAVPDIIVEYATPSQDGVLNVPLTNGAGAGAIGLSTANAGVAGALTLTADTGSVPLPISISLCQTQPASGQCLAPPSATLPVSLGAGTNATFSVFVVVSGPIQFSPGTSRVFLRFLDANGVPHGSASVALKAA